MSVFAVTIRITPREGLLDPEGKAIQGALRSLGFEDADGVRVGRLIRLRVAADSADAARQRAGLMCEKLLANPVTEDFAVDVEAAPSPGATAGSPA